MKKGFLLFFICFTMCVSNICSSAGSIRVINTDKQKSVYVPYCARNEKKLYYKSHRLYKKNNDGKYIKVTKNRLENRSSIKGVYGKYIYYGNDQQRLCRIRIDGKNEKKYKINANNITIECIDKGYLYYYQFEENLGNLKRVKLSTGKIERIIDDISFSSYLFCEDKIFCSQRVELSDGLNNKYNKYFVTKDGKEKKYIAMEYPYDYIIAVNENNIYLLENTNNNYIVKELNVENNSMKVIFDSEDEFNGECYFDFIKYYKDLIFLLKEDDLSLYTLDFKGEIDKIIYGDEYKPFIVDNITVSDNYIRITSNDKWFYYNKDGIYLGRIKPSIKVRGIKCNQYMVIEKKKRITVYYKGKGLIVKKTYKIC